MSMRGAMITVLATELAEAVRADESGEGHDIGAGMFGPAVSAWIRKTVDTYIDAVDKHLGSHAKQKDLTT